MYTHTYRDIYLSIYLSIYLPIDLSIYLSKPIIYDKQRCINIDLNIVCVCIHTYIHTYKHRHIDTYILTHIHTYTHTHIHIHIHIHIHVHVPTYIHTYMYIYMCAYAYRYTYITIYIHMIVDLLVCVSMFQYMPCLFVMRHINSQAFGVSGIPTRNELLKEMNFKPRLSLRDRRALIRHGGFVRTQGLRVSWCAGGRKILDIRIPYWCHKCPYKGLFQKYLKC